MKKEQLTEENIKSDIKYQIKAIYKDVFLCLVILVLLISCYFKMKEFGIFDKLTLVFVILFFILIIILIVEIVYRYIILNKKIILVRDSLYDKYSKTHYRPGRIHNRIYFTYHLRFYRNGKYQLPKIASKYRLPYAINVWSENYCMSDERMYELSDCGDIFYLVLSRGKKGKVLLAYNGKMFDPMPENSVDKTS